MAQLSKTGVKENNRYGYWDCPVCGVHYEGWSPLNHCSSCGYEEKGPTFGLLEEIKRIYTPDDLLKKGLRNG